MGCRRVAEPLCCMMGYSLTNELRRQTSQRCADSNPRPAEYQRGPGRCCPTRRADDHTTGFPICAIVFRDGHLWHERERDQWLVAPDVGAGCCVSCCQHLYSRDSFPMEMEVELKISCLRSALSDDLQTGVMDGYTRGVLWREHACQTFRYHSQLSPEA